MRLAVIGSGFGLYGLLPAFEQLPGCEVVGIAGRQSDRMVDYCRKSGVPGFADWRTMIDTTSPSAVAIAVVPKAQHEIALYALRKKIAVFAEKPLAAHLDDARDLQRIAAQAGVPNMVDFLFPEINVWRKTKNLLAGGAIGEISHVAVNWSFLSNDWKHQRDSWKLRPNEGGGALAFYCSHALHNLEHFLGPLESLQCALITTPLGASAAEVGVNLTVKFECGSSGHLAFDCASTDRLEHSWQFQGTAGSLVLENKSSSFMNGFGVRLLDRAGHSEEIARVADENSPGVDERVPLVKALGARFVDWCAGGRPSRPDFCDGVRVQELIAAARESVRLGSACCVLRAERSGAADQPVQPLSFFYDQ